MSNYPMVDEVNRLVRDLLAAGGAVSLPGVGTLYTERRGAQRLSKRSVLPPCRVVAFTSQLQGTALSVTIAAKAGCSMAEAEEIYSRWLARTREGETLTIGGVGELRFKHFSLDPAFDRLLNPQGREPVRVKPARSFDWALWVGIAAIVIAAAFGGYQFVMLNGEEPAAVAEKVPDTEKPAIRPDDAELPEHVAGTVGEGVLSSEVPAADIAGADGPREKSSVPESVAEQSNRLSDNSAAAGRETHAAVQSGTQLQQAAATQIPTQPDASTEPASLVSGRHYVVLGVYSTPQNAARAVEDASAKGTPVRSAVYRFGEKFMVSPFESADAEPCAQFIQKYKDRFPGLWTYTAR